MIFLSKQVIFRFHANFPGVYKEILSFPGPIFEAVFCIGFSRAPFGGCCFLPGTLNHMHGNGETTIFVNVIWRNPTETTNEKWLFRVPGVNKHHKKTGGGLAKP